jgi:hypothetical protein
MISSNPVASGATTFPTYTITVNAVSVSFLEVVTYINDVD